MEVLLALDLHCCFCGLREKPVVELCHSLLLGDGHWTLDSADTAALQYTSVLIDAAICTNLCGHLYQKRRQICATFRSGFCTIKGGYEFILAVL